MTKHKTKWTETQKGRAQIIFEHYPTLKKAYDLAMKLTDIYNIKSIKDAARLKLAKWFNEVEELGVDNFYTVIDTFENHYQTILNFFVNRATNANAESFNAKVKAFRAASSKMECKVCAMAVGNGSHSFQAIAKFVC